MPIFLVIPLVPDSTPVNSAVERVIPTHDRFHLQADRGWFVKFDGTTIELSTALGVTGHEKGTRSVVGPTLLTPVSTYYGIGNSEMWEWVKTRIEQ